MATIARIPYIHNLMDKHDFLYSTTDVAIWSCCETGLSIVASSVATLKPLFKDIRFSRPSAVSSSEEVIIEKGFNVKDAEIDAPRSFR